MRYIHSMTDFLITARTAVTIGKFDGIHQGHQELINRLKEYCDDDIKSVVFTFDVPPNTFLKGIPQKVLITNYERYRILENFGIDYLIECPFTTEISNLEAEDFVKEILVKRLHVKYIVSGRDNHFGKGRRGDYKLLQEMGREYDFEPIILSKKQQFKRDISSTFIKEEIKRGNIQTVNDLLGYPYTIIGEVEHGNHLGQTIGVPTANIVPEPQKLLPPKGVYASKTVIDGVSYEGITNIGYKPTIGNYNTKGVETFMFDYHGDIYGKEIVVQLYTFERPEKKFASLEDLQKQLTIDIAFGKEFFHEQRSMD